MRLPGLEDAAVNADTRRPLAVDLFCGLGGWTEGLLAEGYRVVGFDIERHRYPKLVSHGSESVKRPGLNWSDQSKRGSRDAQFNRPPDVDLSAGWQEYPSQLILQDVLTLHGSQFRDAALIVASPPCQAYSYMAMPWKRGKAMAAAIRDDQSGRKLDALNALFNACFRIQREASEAAGHHIPMVIENVKGAQPWVGRAAWHYGSFYLWGDVPALMPTTFKVQKFNPDGTNHPQGSWFAIADSKNRGAQGVKQHGHSGRRWFADPDVAGHLSSHSSAHKAASAQIARIPLDLARWVARVYRP